MPKVYKNTLKDNKIKILAIIGAIIAFIGIIPYGHYFVYSRDVYMIYPSIFLILSIYPIYNNNKNGIILLGIIGILFLLLRNIPPIFVLLSLFGAYYTLKDSKIGGTILIISAILIIITFTLFNPYIYWGNIYMHMSIPEILVFFNPGILITIFGTIIIGISGILAFKNSEIISETFKKYFNTQ